MTLPPPAWSTTGTSSPSISDRASGVHLEPQMSLPDGWGRRRRPCLPSTATAWGRSLRSRLPAAPGYRPGGTRLPGRRPPAI